MEVFTGAYLDAAPFLSPLGTLFVTGNGGLGHLVLGSTSDSDGGVLLRASRELRAAGLSVSMSPRAEKPAKLRKSAEDRGAPYAAWLEGGQFQLWQRDGDTTVRGLDAEALVKHLVERTR